MKRFSYRSYVSTVLTLRMRVGWTLPSSLGAKNCVFWLRWRTLSALIFLASETGTTSSSVAMKRRGFSIMVLMASSESSIMLIHSSSTTLTSSSRCCSIVVPEACAISNR